MLSVHRRFSSSVGIRRAPPECSDNFQQKLFSVVFHVFAEACVLWNHTCGTQGQRRCSQTAHEMPSERSWMYLRNFGQKRFNAVALRCYIWYCLPLLLVYGCGSGGDLDDFNNEWCESEKFRFATLQIIEKMWNFRFITIQNILEVLESGHKKYDHKAPNFLLSRFLCSLVSFLSGCGTLKHALWVHAIGCLFVQERLLIRIGLFVRKSVEESVSANDMTWQIV